MESLVKINSNGNGVTTSLIVADIFGKEHNKVCRDIENLSCSENFRHANFGDTPYSHPQNGQTYKSYEMTKDGFSFLVMGYTGEKAGQFKEMFINEFNKRELMLNSDEYILIRASQIQQKTIKMLEEKIQEQKPMIAAFNRVIDAATTYTLDTVSDILNIGRNKLSETLKNMEWAMKDSTKGTASTRYAELQGYAKTVFENLQINGKDQPIKKIVITKRGLDKLINIYNQ